jgi:hypothetical protein
MVPTMDSLALVPIRTGASLAKPREKALNVEALLFQATDADYWRAPKRRSRWLKR